jgi:uncharacterized surface protein with fasciclin (FAS1) repeats
MRKTIFTGILGFLLLLVLGCKKDDIYERPKWLAGKLYSQIESKAELSTFAECIRLVGYDSIINKSGSYTVFAPDNDAWTTFLESNAYSSVADIPREELLRLVKYHIVQNPWSVDQLQQLDVYGWIDSTDLENDEPRGFKRETLLRDENRKYGVKNSLDVVRPDQARKLIIVDSTLTGWKRRQATDSRKYVPIFYQKYMDIYHLDANDYAFYFNRPFEASQIYFVNAKITEADIFAENGFVHVIDRVVEPLKNAFQILSETVNGNSYTDFLDLINTFPVFSYNSEKTKDQPGYEQGVRVDSLFDISYPQLTFDILNEKTKAPAGTSGLPANVTIRYQHGLIAPTNEAMADFVAQYFTGATRWGTLQKAPVHVRRMIVNTHMANGAIYPSLINQGFHNGENDVITINPSTVVQQQFGSNCSFIGVNEVIVPRAFSAITGPVYLQKGYSTAMYAIEAAGLLSAFKRPGKDYIFYVADDASLRIDSSLMYNQQSERFFIYQTYEGGATLKSSRITDIRNLLMNQVGLRKPTGIPRKEFIETLSGNYLVINNVTNVVSGSDRTTFGYKNAEYVDMIPTLIFEGDNGSTYKVPHWFNFTSSDLYAAISAQYPAFHNLLVAAGLADVRNYKYTFLSDDEFYTVFAPTDAALSAYPVGSLTADQLKKFLRMHFIQGSLIFTDGNKATKYYETCRIDEKSTQYTTIYTRLYIEPVIDAIKFRYKNGSNFLTVNEGLGLTNFMTTRVLVSQLGNPAQDLSYPTQLTNGVIHPIYKVFEFGEMDTE